MKKLHLLTLLVGAALCGSTMSSCSDKPNGYDHYKRTHAVQTEEEYEDSMAYVQQNQGQQYNVQPQPPVEAYQQQQASPQVIMVPSYANGYGYNDAGYNNQGYDRSGHYSDRWDYDHHRDPYHAPRSSSVGSHVAAGAVGAAAGAAAGYAYAKSKTTPAPATSTQPQASRFASTRPVSNIVAKPLAPATRTTSALAAAPTPAYKPSTPAPSLRNTDFGNSLTKKYNTSSPSSSSSRPSLFKRSSPSSGSGSFMSRRKRR